jgi:hypothetical protein
MPQLILTGFSVDERAKCGRQLEQLIDGRSADVPGVPAPFASVRPVERTDARGHRIPQFSKDLPDPRQVLSQD